MRPLPAFVVAGRAVFAGVPAAARAATRIVQSGVSVALLELVDERAVAAVNAFAGTAYRAQPTLFLELAGTEAGVRGFADRGRIGERPEREDPVQVQDA